MSRSTITQKQQEILEYIKESILSRGYPPAVREICEAVHLRSTSSVHAHLETLEKKGYIRKDPAKPRTIEIVDDTFNLTRREISNVPMIGRVAAKGAIRQEKRNVFYYSPLISEEEYNAWATDNLIRKLYHGSARDLVAALVQSEGLSRDDIEELRNMFRVEE